MAARKPRIEYYWTGGAPNTSADPKVNWRLVGGNGEVMCSSNQGHQDKTDARRAVARVASVFGGELAHQIEFGTIREVGPGRKPA